MKAATEELPKGQVEENDKEIDVTTCNAKQSDVTDSNTSGDNCNVDPLTKSTDDKNGPKDQEFWSIFKSCKVLIRKPASGVGKQRKKSGKIRAISNNSRDIRDYLIGGQWGNQLGPIRGIRSCQPY